MAALLLVVVALQAPPFTHSVSRVTAAGLPHSWHPGCPVAPASLRRLRLAYWGFDGRVHTGALIVNAKAVGSLTRVFSRLYAARFPIRRLRPIDAYGGSDERSLEADNTAAFNCRYAVASGPKRWSVHAYGLAVDVNPVENPYVLGGRVIRVRAARTSTARATAGDGGFRRPARAHLRLGRLAVGRPLDGLARLPALLRDGRLMDVVPGATSPRPADRGVAVGAAEPLAPGSLGSSTATPGALVSRRITTAAGSAASCRPTASDRPARRCPTPQRCRQR